MTYSLKSTLPEMPVGFTFDQAKCTGCQACVLACTIENGLAFDSSWRNVHTYNDRHYPNVPYQHLSLACNHCENPACLEACPAGAYTRSAETGFVELDETQCIGCRYCSWACPYGAPKYEASKGIIGKCTFCRERQDSGRKPACVELCPTGALGVGPRENSVVRHDVPGFPRTKLGPAFAVVPESKKRAAPETSTTPESVAIMSKEPQISVRSLLRDRWPLAAFTFLIPILVGLVATGVFTSQMPALATFVGTSGAAAVLSSAHLGRKTRAWRSLMNPITSWLSREVLLFGALVACGVTYISLVPNNKVAGWLALAIGFTTLISIDRVYATLPQLDGRRHHSADSVVTGLLLLGVFSANPLVAAFLGVGKLLLYLQRKIDFWRSGKSVRVALSALRIVGGLLLPAVVWSLSGGELRVAVIVAVLFGELIDRLEFYAELDLVTPERQMQIDLKKAISS